ncbi:hypothetical protein GCWU000342_02101 [Shuttleworthella satelles DSM 14600]|uniref:Uncharacterized protein n=1 Tax=Shuttleworthella satelles DSM 14600 TaxID=626523 RepID=C4GDC8_9FIRM|nr:hypothetical protein GCWU000342_02101 [Shuttleworthia satelles DSM 14600]
MGQLNQRFDGQAGIHPQIKGQEQGQDDGRQGVFPIRHFHGQGDDPFADYDAGQAEADGGRKADAAVKIQGDMAVIPPDRVKELFQEIGGQIFHDGGADHADQEDLPEGNLGQAVVSERQLQAIGLNQIKGKVPEEEEAEDCAKAIDGADGAVEEAPVVPVAVSDGAVAALIEPADEGKEHELVKVRSQDHKVYLI